MSTIFDFKVKDGNGEEVTLEQYKGQVILIINSATGCGFTPQYKELQPLYDEFKDKGFVILDFPCNQFANQAPGDDKEIHEFCSSRYGVTFPIFAKLDVNGENASPLFAYLKEEAPFKGGFKMKMLGKLSKKSNNKNDIKWNFTKFLINRDGKVIERFEPDQGVKVVKEAVEKIL